MARMPIKSQRETYSMPGVPFSTMKAVICFFSRPLTVLEGVRAMTQMTSATRPLVHQSLVPLILQVLPSVEGVAVTVIWAGSEPTPGSVKAKAEMAPLANMGKYFLFWVSLQNHLRGWGTPMDWWAESQTAVEPQ